MEATSTAGLGTGPGRTTAMVAALLLVAVPLSAAPAQAGSSTDGTSTCRPQDRVDVSLVLDRSESMSGDKIEAAKEGADFLVKRLEATDRSGLVSYASDARLDQSLTADHAQTRNDIAQLDADGSTATGDAIDVSHTDLQQNGRAGADPIMIVLTDGHTNTGSDPVVQAQEAKEDGVEVFAVGLGPDVNEDALKQIASQPNASHYFNPDDAQELKGVFRDLTQAVNGTAAVGESYGVRGKVVPEGPVPGQLTIHRTNQSIYPDGGSAAVGTVTRSAGSLDVRASVLESTTAGNRTGASVGSRATTALASVEVRADGELLLEAESLRATSTSRASVDGPAESAGGVSVGLVRVPGVGNFTGPFAPGARIPLGDAGNLTVNETHPTTEPGESGLRVNALHLNLTLGNTTADLILGSAFSAASCATDGHDAPHPAASDPVAAESRNLPEFEGEDPPMTGFGPLHPPAGLAPDRDVDREVPGVLEVSRQRSETSGENYRFVQDRVTVRVPPADTSVSVVYYQYTSEYDSSSSTHDAAYLSVCTPVRCSFTGLSFSDYTYQYSTCEGQSSYLSAYTEAGGAGYFQSEDECSSGGERDEFRCRSAWGYLYGGVGAGASRCSEEQASGGQQQENENGYDVWVYAPTAYVAIEHENRLAENETTTEVQVSTLAGTVSSSVTLPPPGPGPS